MNTGKQVHYSEGPEGPYVNRDNEGLQSVPGQQPLPFNQKDYIAVENANVESKRILGLTVAAFWTVVVVLVLIIAGGIGGGVGGGLAAQNKNNKNATASAQTSFSSSSIPITSSSITLSSSSASSTGSSTGSSTSSSSSSTTTTSSAPSSSVSPIISTPCIANPSANGTTLTALNGQGVADGSFTLLCNTNYPADGENPGVSDLLKLWVPDMNSCINACALYNTGFTVSSGGLPCVVVAVVRAAGEYCYLKSSVGINDTSTSNGAPIDSAILT